MPCEIKLISSNSTGLHIAEEACFGVLPDPENTTVWYEQEPNSYDDFTANYTSVKRDPITATRKNKKGAIVSEEVSNGFTCDFTKSNLTRFLQGFFFADARQPASIKTQLNGVTKTLTSAAMGNANGGLDDSFSYASNHLDGAGYAVGDLIKKYGWDEPLDNGVAKILTVGTTALTCTSDVARTNRTIASPPANAGFEVVGIEFASGDVSVSFVSSVLALTSTVYNFSTNTNLFPGQWIYLGADGAKKFDNNVGFARIRSITANTLVLEAPTWTPATESGTGKVIRLFFGISIKDESIPALIKRRTYQIERSLGLSTEGNSQAEYQEGCVPNEFKVTFPTREKITASLGFMGAKSTERSGLGSDLIKLGTRVSALKEAAINSSSHLRVMRMGLTDDTSMVSSLFAYLTEASLTISNGITIQPALGLLGGLEATSGNFMVSGSVQAYFANVAAKTAIRKLSDVNLTFIVCAYNAGSIFDLPKIGVSGGSLDVSKDAPIMMPLESEAYEGKHGYTAIFTEFRYLPTIAMPS